jgi:hypothetical protein
VHAPWQAPALSLQLAASAGLAVQSISARAIERAGDGMAASLLSEHTLLPSRCNMDVR